MAKDKDWAENVTEVRQILEDLCQKIDVRKPVASGLAIGKDFDIMTLEEFARSINYTEHAMNMVRISTRALLGVEPSDMSALYLLDYCKSAGGLLLMRSDSKHGGQYLRIVSGKENRGMP
jgi:monoamine oxidase